MRVAHGTTIVSGLTIPPPSIRTPKMFKGLGNIGNLAGMIGKFQEIPQRMQELNARMKSERVSSESGCGRVNVTMNGVGELQSVTIDPAFKQDDTVVLEQAVVEATNAAGAAAKELYASSIRDLAAELDLGIPGMDGLLESLTP